MKKVAFLFLSLFAFACEVTTSTNVGVAKNVIGEYPVYKIEKYSNGKLSSTTSLPTSSVSMNLSITKTSGLNTDSNVNMTLMSSVNGIKSNVGPLGFDVFKSSSNYYGTISDGDYSFELSFVGTEAKVIARNKNITESIVYARKP